MVEVFKTNVTYQSQAQGLLTLLRQYFPKSKVNFDLDDCDKILRIQGDEFCPVKLAELLKTNGFDCDVLD